MRFHVCSSQDIVGNRPFYTLALGGQRDALLTNTPSSYDRQRIIGPLHTAGPVGLTPDGTRMITCVGEQAILTDIQSGGEVCRFLGVRFIFRCALAVYPP